MGFVEELLKEQEQLLTDELRFAEGEEFIETGNRLTDVKNALIKLGLCDVVVAKRTLSNLDKAIKKAKPNMDKIKDVDKHIDSIR